MKTLYVSDMDGTLLQPDQRLSAVAVTMLNRAIAEGKLFTVATARTPATVGPILRDLHMNLPCIVMTGAAMWDSATNHYSHLRLFKPEVIARVLDVYRRTGTPTFVYSIADDMITVRHIGELTELQKEFVRERSTTPYKRFEMDAEGRSVFPEVMDDVILLYVMLDNEQARVCHEITEKIPGVRSQLYHDIYGDRTALLDAFAPDATKANAVRDLADELGADRIVCFGDNINDLPMMREADLAVAVENAHPDVLAAADIVIGPNTSDSVAKFILDH